MNKKDIIKNIIQQNPKHYSKMILGNSELSNWVNANSVVSTDNFAEKIYSAVYQDSGLCSRGQRKKFTGINHGYAFCGRANICNCSKEKVSQGVKQTKSLYTQDQKEKINESRKKTTLEKYGVTNNAQTEYAKIKHKEFYQTITKIKPKKLSNYQKLNKKFKSQAGIEFITEETDYQGVSDQIYYDFRCTMCSTEFSDYVDNGHVPKCKTCYPYVPSYTSKQETQVCDFIKSQIDVPVLQSDRSLINPYELDILIPSKQIAIEYCGLYWHSEVNKLDSNYHAKKLQLCNQKGYRLITIFEDEWLQKRKIVENRLKSILGVSLKIPARKCKVFAIPIKQARDFLNEHHIQGNSVCKYSYGCFYENQLVAVMSFGKPRYTKDLDFELIRYASVGTIVGGAGKLLKKFIIDHKPASIISYCDLRWGNGKLYQTLGFDQTTTSGVGYYYTDFSNRYHRSNFTKRSLVKEGANPLLTEHEIMKQKKMYRIWNCGTSRWVYKC
jgi:hypothetical protein